MILIRKNYLNYYTEKAIKIRRNIKKVNNKFYKHILMSKYEKLLFKFQCYYPLSDNISNKIVFPHGLCGIFISSDAIIGENCVIFQQVTIGSNTLSDSKSKGAPKFGNNCYIGAGAKIIGNVCIGDNVRIGANTVVTKDITNNSTVVGASIRIINHNKELDNHFIKVNEKGNGYEK